jgi:hypothetical protein
VEYREAGIERTRDDVVRAEQHGAPRRVTTLIAPQGQPRRSGGPHDAPNLRPTDYEHVHLLKWKLTRVPGLTEIMGFMPLAAPLIAGNDPVLTGVDEAPAD